MVEGEGALPAFGVLGSIVLPPAKFIPDLSPERP
jgi:hypothetical protein